jgi:hypothetical protein
MEDLRKERFFFKERFKKVAGLTLNAIRHRGKRGREKLLAIKRRQTSGEMDTARDMG